MVRVATMLSVMFALVAPGFGRPWSEDVMYFVVTDRFHDADPANNHPAGCDPALYDPHQKDLARYLAGNLRGIENAIQAGYFTELGVTALWLNPGGQKRLAVRLRSRRLENRLSWILGAGLAGHRSAGR